MSRNAQDFTPKFPELAKLADAFSERPLLVDGEIVVLDAQGRLPSTEQSALQAIAPIATSAEALAALPDQPLKLSKGLAGFAFYDAGGSLILVVSNPSTRPDAKAISGTIQLAKLEAADGVHQLRNLLTGASQPVTVSGHGTTFPVEVARWDTVIFSLAQS